MLVNNTNKLCKGELDFFAVRQVLLTGTLTYRSWQLKPGERKFRNIELS